MFELLVQQLQFSVAASCTTVFVTVLCVSHTVKVFLPWVWKHRGLFFLMTAGSNTGYLAQEVCSGEWLDAGILRYPFRYRLCTVTCRILYSLLLNSNYLQKQTLLWMEANKPCQHLASSKSGDYSFPKEVCCLSSVFVGLQCPTHLQTPTCQTT